MSTTIAPSEARAARAAAAAAERGLDALLVTDLASVRWLTGYSGSNGLALVGPDLRVFVTDFRYESQAAEQVRGFDVAIETVELLDAVARLLPQGAGRVGFDDAKLAVKPHAKLAAALDGRAELVAAAGAVEALRMVKEPAEIAAIAAAAELADEACEAVVGRGLAGRTEREVALDLEFELRRRGAEAVSFEPIVAAGAHGALPHAEPRDVAIPHGTLVVVDWGARLDGYCSDCTRTFATGEVGEEERAVYELVLEAQVRSLAAVRAGAGGREVDAVARDVIAAAGHGERFGHGLGHGVGVEVHEGPRLSRLSEATLAAGNVVTVEPGIYLPGAFGVRIEDLVVVTDGEPRVLSGMSKQLTLVG